MIRIYSVDVFPAPNWTQIKETKQTDKQTTKKIIIKCIRTYKQTLTFTFHGNFVVV